MHAERASGSTIHLCRWSRRARDPRPMLRRCARADTRPHVRSQRTQGAHDDETIRYGGRGCRDRHRADRRGVHRWAPLASERRNRLRLGPATVDGHAQRVRDRPRPSRSRRPAHRVHRDEHGKRQHSFAVDGAGTRRTRADARRRGRPRSSRFPPSTPELPDVLHGARATPTSACRPC